jgi:hypothetical protein
MNRNFESIIYGSKKFIINENGQLIEDKEKGQTGIEFLYKNWEKIKFERNESTIRSERIDVLNAYKKNVLFTSYWIVIPAFYRDVNLQSASRGVISHHELNDKYSKLINLTSMLNDENNFDFILNTTKAKIQETLVDIYDFFKGKIEKKQGIIRRSILGKSIDYGSRSVISAPVFNANRPEEMQIDFFHAGIPLAQCCSMFTPFIMYWVRRFFQRELEKNGNRYPVKTKEGEIKFVKLKDPQLYFNEEFIKKQIDRFVHSYADRFQLVELPVEDETYNKKIYLSFIGREYRKGATETESPLVQRPATWCDIFYQAAVDVTVDKMVYITRYPILDYFGSFPNQISVLSTHETVPMYVGTKIYRNYPKIDLNII